MEKCIKYRYLLIGNFNKIKNTRVNSKDSLSADPAFLS